MSSARGFTVPVAKAPKFNHFSDMVAGSFKVTAVVAFYMFSALVMVFVNKAVLNNAPDLPLLFLMTQLIIAVVLLHLAAAVSTRIDLPRWDFDVAKKLIPVVSVNIIGLVFNTLCLRGVDASFFQIARGLVLPLTIAVSTFYTRVKPTAKVIVAAGLVTVGFFIGVTPISKNLPTNSQPSLLSLFYGALSSLFIALHAVYIKTSLPCCNNSTIQLAWWTNIGSAILLLPALILRGEHALLQEKISGGVWDAKIFFWGSMTTGVFGFLMCIAGLLSIKITSPITHMFSSAARTVLQTLLGVWVFGDIMNVHRAISITVITGGTLCYTWIKSVEASSQPVKSQILRDLESGDLNKQSPQKDKQMRPQTGT